MGALVDEEGRELIAQGRNRLVYSKHCEGQLLVPGVRTASGEGKQRFANDTDGPQPPARPWRWCSYGTLSHR